MRTLTNNKWLLLFIILSITLRLASAPTANISYILIAGFAMFGRAQAIQALLLSWLFTMINPALAPDSGVSAAGRYIVIFTATASVIFSELKNEKKFTIKKLSLLTLALGILMLGHSLALSRVVDVSVLKSVSWTVVVVTLLAAWQGLPPLQRKELFNQIQWALICLILLSLPLLAIPSIGFLRNGTGFQGLLNHPQAFGPTVALVGVLVGGRILGKKKPAWRDIILFGMCLVLIVFSEARTAGIAMVTGLIGSALFSPLFAGVSRKRMLPGLRSRRFQHVIFIILAGTLLAGPFLSEKISNYLFKRTDAVSLIAAADASRGALVERMINNIYTNPWTGIGFGIASIPEEMQIERDSVFNLPLSAPIEKGVMPIALVEELGIVCALLIFAWFFISLKNGAKSGVVQFSLLLTTILVNLGESMFFSAGGMGMLLLIFFTGAVTSSQRVSVSNNNV